MYLERTLMANKKKEKYRLANGEVVPGTTTIVGELGWNKNVLVNWANRLGLQGHEARGYVDDKASIGSLAHAFVLAEFKGEQPDTKDYTANQIELAKNCLASYQEWKGKRKIEPIVVEKMLVSEEHGYGGTPDFFGGIDGVLTLVDYKTGSGIYSEHIIQVAAYHNLLTENKYAIADARILSIPRSSDESFSEKIIKEEEIRAGLGIFLHLLAIWNLKGVIKKDI
jgi:hypothetical protein